jgi:transcriptional regulator with XRE-family HTH domain
MFELGLIKALRKKIGLSQQELADKVGVSRSAIFEWERGGYFPEGNNLLRLATVLNTSVGYLIGETDDPKRLPDSPVVNISIEEKNSLSARDIKDAFVGDIKGRATIHKNEQKEGEGIVIEHGEGANKTRVILPVGTSGDVIARVAKELRG